MRQRFTVIEGGAAPRDMSADAPVAEAVSATGPTPSLDPVAWRIDLRRPGAVDAEAVAAWRALLVRIGAPDPVQADPDYLLSAAQHRAGGRDIVVALAWAVGNGPDRLAAAIPLALPHALWGNGRIVVWQPHGVCVAPAASPDSFGAMRAALTEHLRSLRPRAVLVLDAEAGEIPAAIPATRLRALPQRASIPARSLVGIRALHAPAPVRVERISEPHRIRDAVEAFLLLDAETAAAPIIGDPSEAALVRVVTRLFAQRRQVTVALTHREDAIVAATITLGTGAHAITWRHAEGEAAPRRIDRLA